MTGSKARLLQAATSDAGESPLDYMLRVMRDDSADPKRRDAMAVAAAAYVHPRLAAVTVDAEVRTTHEQALAELEGAAIGTRAPAVSHTSH